MRVKENLTLLLEAVTLNSFYCNAHFIVLLKPVSLLEQHIP